MISKIRKYFTRSEFVKNSLILISGTTIAQLLPVFMSPILSRLFRPDEIGVLTMFSSIVIILSLIASGRYELAIVLPKKDSDGMNILFLSFFLTFAFSIFLFIILIFFQHQIIGLLKEPKLYGWLYLVPLNVFFLAGFNSLSYYYTRIKDFKLQSKNRVIRAIVSSFMQIALYFTKIQNLALLGGFSAGQLTGNMAMMRGIIKDKENRKKVSKVKMIALARRYKRFPQVQLPSTLLNRLSTDLPNLMLTGMFSSAVTGLYGMSNRVLASPSSFIGIAISQVFMQAAANEYRKTGKAVKIFKSVLKQMLLLGVPIFLIIGLFGKYIFVFVLGKQWAEAGIYSQILAPLFFARFVVGSLSSVLFVFEKHKIIFNLQIVMFLLTLAIFVLKSIFNLDIMTFFGLFSGVLTLYYFVYLFILWKVVR